MANPWFRMYHEFATDPKVQMMDEKTQRRFVMLLCLRCCNGDVTLHETEIAFHLRITDQELAETKALFIAKGFVDSEWNLLNWEKRQMLSDTSNARVAKHRALSKAKQEAACNVTEPLLKRESNGLEEIRTDIDKKIPSLSKPAVIDCPHEKILDAFSEKLPNLAQPIRSLWRDGKNAPALKARWAWLMTACHEKGKRKGERMATTEAEGVEWFGRFFAYVADSDFLMGRSSEWSCDLIWLVNKSNFEKVIQGTYENKSKEIAA